MGPYQIQAAIAVGHATAPTLAATDWGTVATLYGQARARHTLARGELNEAVAVAMAKGLEVGLARVDALDASDTRGGYCLLPA